MKKKTAITLSALALLAGGITFSGIKIKEKKEKEKIEAELKSVLIPNAEKKLDELLKEDKKLQDSIVYYQDLFDSIEHKEVSQGKKTVKTLGEKPDFVNSVKLVQQSDSLIVKHIDNLISLTDSIINDLQTANTKNASVKKDEVSGLLKGLKSFMKILKEFSNSERTDFAKLDSAIKSAQDVMQQYAHSTRIVQQKRFQQLDSSIKSLQKLLKAHKFNVARMKTQGSITYTKDKLNEYKTQLRKSSRTNG